MVAIGLEPHAESSQPLTDVNPENGGHACDVILLVEKSFNKECISKEPWDLIRKIIGNQPLGSKLINTSALLQPPNQTSILA